MIPPPPRPDIFTVYKAVPPIGSPLTLSTRLWGVKENGWGCLQNYEGEVAMHVREFYYLDFPVQEWALFQQLFLLLG